MDAWDDLKELGIEPGATEAGSGRAHRRALAALDDLGIPIQAVTQPVDDQVEVPVAPAEKRSDAA